MVFHNQLILEGATRKRFFAWADNIFEQDINPEFYHHLAIIFYASSETPGGVARLIDSYASDLFDLRMGLLRNRDISYLTHVQLLHESFMRHFPNSLRAADGESAIYERVYERAHRAALNEYFDGGPRIAYNPTQITSGVRSIDDGTRNIGLLDDHIGESYGRNYEEQQITHQIVGDAPSRSVHDRAGIKLTDKPLVIAKKVRSALKTGKITPEEAANILKIRRIPKRLVNYAKSVTPDGDQVVEVPSKLTKDVDNLVENVKADIGDTEIANVQRSIRDLIGVVDESPELSASRLRQEEAVQASTTRLSGLSERLNQNVTDLAKIRRDRAGFVEAGTQVLRTLGLYRSNSERIVRGIFQFADRQIDRVRAFTNARTDNITKTAADLGLNLNDFRRSVRIYRALDLGDDITPDALRRLNKNERAVYQHLRSFLGDRERWTLSVTSDILAKHSGLSVEENATLLQRFADNHFRSDYFSRSWIRPSSGEVVTRDQADALIRGSNPAAFQQRTTGDLTFDELLEAGFRPKYINPAEALKENTLDLLEALHEAEFISELVQAGVIRQSPPSDTAALALHSLDRQLSLNPGAGQTLGLPNGDTFIKGDFNISNTYLNSLAEVLPDTGVSALVLGENYYVTRNTNQLLKNFFNVRPKGVLNAFDRVSRKLKLIKLALSLYQLFDLTTQRAPQIFFNTSQQNWYGFKGLITYPEYLIKSYGSFFSPRLARDMRAIFSGEKPVIAFYFKGEPVFVHQIPGLSQIPYEYRVKIDNFAATNEKYQRIGQLAQDWAERQGVPSSINSTAQAGLKFARLVENGINTYNRYNSERLFDGVAGYTQLRFLQTVLQQQADNAGAKLSLDQFLVQAGKQANLFNSSQRYWDSVFNSPVKQALASIFLFSSEPESFLRIGFGPGDWSCSSCYSRSQSWC